MIFKKFYRLFRIAGIPIYVHWSAALMFGIFFVAAPFGGLPLLFIALGLFVILLVHELGHAFLARRFGYEVEKIEIFPIHGLCFYDEPYSEYEGAVIAWGGVAAQMLLFIPAAAFLGFFGNTSLGSVNILLIAFSYINGVSMVINLTPGPGLDGLKAWRLLPIVARAKWNVYQLKRKKILK